MSSVPVRPVRAERSVRHGVLRGRDAGVLLVEVMLLAVFIGLAVAVKRHPGPLPGDVGLELDVQHAVLPHRFLTNVLDAVSTLNWPIPATITIAIIMLIFLLLRRWLDALAVVATLAVIEGTGTPINRFIHRPRPSDHGIHVLAVIRGSYSFPSGHVIHATAVFGMFLFLTTQVRHQFHPAIVWLVRLVAVAVIVLMPISRVEEGEHWPSDVLGGLLYGAFWLIIAAYAYLWARNRWPRLLARDER
ncbi:MAG TPA: phosphatase PAP2 family protein [Chloroflexota bacterium]